MSRQTDAASRRDPPATEARATPDPARDRSPTYRQSLDCVHCGLCLPVCPTYGVTARESDSPRGRIYLMRAMLEGRLSPSTEAHGAIDRCLVCRACETACPSGVAMGEMVAHTRDVMERSPLRRGSTRRLKRLAFRHLLPHPRRLACLAWAASVYRRLGIARGLRLTRIDRGWLGRLHDALHLLPEIPPRRLRRRPPAISPAAGNRTGGKVALLVGCAAHQLTPGATWSAIRLLNRHGVTVHCPRSQPCCGALALHYGDRATARRLARRTIDAMLASDPERIVTTSAGCGAAMKEYGDLLEADEHYAARARLVAGMTVDVCEYLAEIGLDEPGPLTLRVAYDDACHLLHAQRISEQPRRLLGAIPGLEIVESPEASVCCGAAGIYNLLEPEMSRAILERKIDALRSVRPDVVATANPGCLLQIDGGLRRAGVPAEVLHPVEVLDRAFAADGGSPDDDPAGSKPLRRPSTRET